MNIIVTVDKESVRGGSWSDEITGKLGRVAGALDADGGEGKLRGGPGWGKSSSLDLGQVPLVVVEVKSDTRMESGGGWG